MPKGIRPEGKCEECKGRFKWNEKKKAYRCPAHGTTPGSFSVYVSYKGEQIFRARNIEGEKLRTHYDAQKLVDRAESEKKNGKFDPERWRSKALVEYHPGRLIIKWYRDKSRALRKGDLKPSYVAKLKSYIRIYYIPYGIDKHLDDIRDIRSTKDFFNNLPDHLSSKYRKNIKLGLATFFNWAKKEMRLIDEIPYFPRIKTNKRIPTVVSKEFQIDLLNNFIKSYHRPIFGYMIHQGCRLGEAAVLKGSDFKQDPNLGLFVIYRRTLSEGIVVETPKDGDQRANPVFNETLEFLPKPLTHDYLFKRPGGDIYSLTALEKEFARALKVFNKAKRQEANSRGEVYDDIKITLYEFVKHSWSSQMYERGASLEDLKEYHGHSKLETSLIYTKIDVLSRFKKLADVVPFENQKKKSTKN